MKQLSMTDVEYGQRKRMTKREEFLRKMDAIIPWAEWVAYVEPYYPQGNRGRKPLGIEKMLRMFLLQCWFDLSDIGVEDAIYDSYAFRSFMGINFYDEQAPDATTLLKFRHLLEENKIPEKLFGAINNALEQSGCLMRGGTIVDATIIQAPSSTKNVRKERDPEMKSTKKGNQYFFGCKAHIGVDAGSGYVHSLEVTSANIHDVTVAGMLLRPDDYTVYGDSGYLGLPERAEVRANDQLSKIDYRINRRPSSVKKSGGVLDWERNMERRKSSVRSKVEHPFLLVKRYFGYAKVRYRGLYKNAQRLFMLFTSANIVMCMRAGRKLVTKPVVIGG